METKQEVVRVSDLSVDDFERKFLTKECPVVINSCLKDLSIANWNFEYLLSRVADNEVNVRGRTNCQEYKVGKNYTLRKTTFREYIQDLQKCSARGSSSYMAVQNIAKVFPQLSNECVLPAYIRKVHNGPFMWIAQKGHYEFCHFDPDEGMLMIIEGRKRVKLYKSSDLDELYPNPLGSKGKTIQSQVDCEKPDLEKYSRFRNATCFECVLNSGDALYIPAFWWHQVTSETISVSINVFFGDFGTNRYISRHLVGQSWPAFRYWILNIVEQNRQHKSFQRTLERLKACIENLLLKQFHEVATEEQLNFLVKMIMEYLQISELPKFSEGGKHPPPLKIRGLRWR
ncbi:tRNA wybutosine-synthesizing protein 5-like [Styela clava]